MKIFAFVLLCALAAVQARNTGVLSTRSDAALGENPWVVHLRIAVSDSGLLETCAGSLIGDRWVLTAASCVSRARFIWLRYGVVNVINPSMVTETSAVRIHPGYIAGKNAQNNIALVNINRVVHETDHIGPVPLGGEAGESGTFCGFGELNSGPGEQLSCVQVGLSGKGRDLKVSSDEVVASKFDIGGPLVSNGAQIGLLAGPGSNFLATADYLAWIQQETGLLLNAEAPLEVAPEAVRFVD